MKRFDRVPRVPYVVFLLVLLADVAWAHASVPVGGDAHGGLILSAAGQLQVGSTGAVLSGSRRASLQVAGFRSYRLSFAGWSRSLAQQASHADWVTQPVLASSPERVAFLVDSSRFASPGLGMLEHRGRPAP